MICLCFKTCIFCKRFRILYTLSLHSLYKNYHKSENFVFCAQYATNETTEALQFLHVHIYDLLLVYQQPESAGRSRRFAQNMPDSKKQQFRLKTKTFQYPLSFFRSLLRTIVDLPCNLLSELIIPTWVTDCM